jgi:hypothetical protein
MPTEFFLTRRTEQPAAQLHTNEFSHSLFNFCTNSMVCVAALTKQGTAVLKGRQARDIRWGALLSEADPHETHAKRLRRGLEGNLDFLMEQVEQRVSAARQKPVIALIETGRVLKDKRNENVQCPKGRLGIHSAREHFCGARRQTAPNRKQLG